MKQIQRAIVVFMVLLCGVIGVAQQRSVSTNSSAVVPPLVRFSGNLTEVSGKPLTGVVGVTFSLYKDEQGGAPLWLETQNVTADSNGRYTVMLGSTTSTGLPADIFVAGEARWIAVQSQGQSESPRVLLLSVPYALKAEDAQTLGGLPASAFVLAATKAGEAVNSERASKPATVSSSPRTTSDVTTTGGTVNSLPLFSTATNIQNSAITQTGSGTTAKIGINTTTPTATLFVNGGTTSNGLFTMPTTGNATAAAGKNSQPQDFVASVFNSGTGIAVAQKFQWQAEAVNNDKTTATGSLNLLYASGSSTPAETGLHVGGNGQITFATGQAFPGVADLSASNTFTGTQTINNTVTVSGTNTVGVLQVTSTPTTGAIPAILATGDSSIGYGVYGTSPNVGVYGNGSGSFGIGLDGHGTFQGAKGVSSATTGVAQGLYGQSSSTGGYGVEGAGPNVGVYGASAGASITGIDVGTITGIWGDTGGSSNSDFVGVTGTADENYAGYFNNNSSLTDTVYMENDAKSSSTANVLATLGAGFGGACTINVSGDLACTGSKSAVVPVDGGARRVKLYAVEAPENWFEDAGSGQLANGAARIELDSTFAQTVNTGMEYHVFLTPKGDCDGLYVSNETAQGFEVHELHGGRSSVAFDYRILAKRVGYENVRLADVTERFKQTEQQGQTRRQRVAELRAKSANEPTTATASAAHK